MSDATPPIELSGVSKHYTLSAGSSRSLKAAALDLLRPRRRQRRLIKALDEVSFEVRRGETVGIIGANGAGKSTLLSLITGTIQPTHGTIRTHGSISSLLELGAGFHPDLSGRENVFLYGAIMGMSRAYMRERFDAIVEFAGLEEFIDQPVKYYSSGMYVRLGFAVAVEVDPDILLIDEVLAVGDANFQQKCIAKMEEFRQRGRTMLIISHDLSTIQKVSDRILLLDHGRVMGLGTPTEMIDQYEAQERTQRCDTFRREWGSGEVQLHSVELRDTAGEPTDTIPAGRGLSIQLGYRSEQRIERPVFGFSIADADGHTVHGSNTQHSGLELASIEGEGRLQLDLPELPLAPGHYMLSLSAHSWDHKTNFHRLDHAFPFIVTSDTSCDGCLMLTSQWSHPHA